MIIQIILIQIRDSLVMKKRLIPKLLVPLLSGHTMTLIGLKARRYRMGLLCCDEFL